MKFEEEQKQFYNDYVESMKLGGVFAPERLD